MRTLGIDIGSYSIKTVVLDGDDQNYRIESMREYPLKTDPNSDHRLEIIEILRSIDDAELEANVKFVTALRLDEVALRQLLLPFRERHKIMKSLPFELEEEIPLTAENSVYEAKITRFRDAQTEVAAIACPKVLLQNSLRELADSNIEPDIMSVDALALANLFESWNAAPPNQPMPETPTPELDRAEAHLHIGHRSALCIILRDQQFVDGFHIDWGFHDLVMHLGRKYNLQYSLALSEAQAKAFILLGGEDATPDQVLFSQRICESVDSLAGALRLGLAESTSRHRLDLQSLTLSGGGSAIRNLGPYLTQKLEMATNRLSRLDRHPHVQLNSEGTGYWPYAVAFGLALEGLKRPINPPINLLRGEFARQNQNRQKFWRRHATGLKLALALYLSFCTYAYLREVLTQDLVSTTEVQLLEMAKTEMKVKGRGLFSVRREVKAELERLNGQERRIREIEALQNWMGAPEILAKISSSTPPRQVTQLAVKKLKIEDSIVEVEGEAANSQSAAAFKKSLENLALEQKVDSFAPSFPGLKSSSAFGYRFKIFRKATR